MQTEWIVVSAVAGLIGLAALLGGLFVARRLVAQAAESRDRVLSEARQDAENRKRELVVAAQEKSLALEEELESRERDLEQRENRLEQRQTELEKRRADVDQRKKQQKRIQGELDNRDRELASLAQNALADQARVREQLEHIAGLTTDQARDALIAEIEDEARARASRLARKIEDEAREDAERSAIQLMVQAAQRVNIRDVAESTVSFIELPSDEMKGRIIGKEGRNIRALEMATGIDLVVDDTPRTILISSFDPVRREVARVAIAKLVEDGRIHPARIEEVVQRVRDDVEELIDEKGAEAAFGLGIPELHPRLTRLVGRMRFHNGTGQNLLQHCLETAMIAGHMAAEIGAREDVAQRAGLLHEIGQVDEGSPAQPIVIAAELCAKYDEPAEVVEAIRALHPNVAAKSLEALLVATANRLSDSRPGARKENLAVFIERLRRLEGIATSFAGVGQAYAVKAGKEIRVIADAAQAADRDLPKLSKQIARAIEKELNYPGQIKVHVIRETRAVRFAV